MKMLLPGISHLFDCDNCENINCVVIENPKLFYDIYSDITKQLEGNEGKCVLSEQNTIIPFSKNLEMLSQFVPFELNKKNLLNKMQSRLAQLAIEDVNYAATMEILSIIEKYCLELSMNMTGNIEFTKISPENLFKCAGAEFEDDYESLSEKLIDYMELVREYDKEKLFVIVNLRSYILDEELELFFETCLSHNYQVMMIDSSEHELLSKEKRFIIDKDLCEIY